MEFPKIIPPALQWIKVMPNSPEDEFVGSMADGTWKIRVAAKARENKANQRIVLFLEKTLGRPVEIVRGQTSSRKLIKIL